MPTVLITGANRGIGLEFARQYSGDGCGVIATTRQSSGELEALGARIELLDMRELDAVARFGERLNGTTLDLLIANAGTDHPKSSETAEDARAWVDMLAVNSIAPFILARSVLPRMSKGGKLVAISSKMGSIADNGSGGWIPYRSSKAALNAAWHSLAIEVRQRGLIAAMYNPGWVKTRMGGPNAPLPAQQSIASLRRLIEDLSCADSGGFFDHDGTVIPW